MLSVVIHKPYKSRLCSSVPLSQSAWAFELTLHNSSARPDSPCADSPDRDLRFTLITEVSVIKRLSLSEFTLWGRDLVSVVCIRKSPYYRGFF